MTVAALEQTADAVDIDHWPVPFPCCLILGHEVDGVRPEILDLVDVRVEIPMWGAKRSLNVAVSFGVAAFSLRRSWCRQQEDDAP